MKLISTKFNGVYYNLLQTKDKVFYIKYYKNKKQVQEKIGSLSLGITAQYAANVRNERLTNPNFIKKSHMFEDVLNKYITKIYRLKSFKSTKIRIFKHILPFFKNMKFEDIKTSDIYKFKEYLLKHNVSYAPQTIKHYIIILRQIFNYAKTVGLYDGDNPATADKVTLPRFDNSRNCYLSNDEIERLIKTCNSGELRQSESSLILFALYTGCRKSEILNLKWQEVNIEDKYVRLVNTKSAKNHIIILSELALKELEKMYSVKTSDYVFYSSTGEQFQDVRFLWNKVKQLADIRPEVRFHDLRHTFGTSAVSAGVPLDVLSKMMTHANIKTTQRYAHIVDKRFHDAAKQIDKIFTKGGNTP